MSDENFDKSLDTSRDEADAPSADPALTRKQFLQRVVKGAAVTGGVLGAPKILDKFLAPAAFAATSTVCVIGENTSGGYDTVIQSRSQIDIACLTTGFQTVCAAGTDADLVCP